MNKNDEACGDKKRHAFQGGVLYLQPDGLVDQTGRMVMTKAEILAGLSVPSAAEPSKVARLLGIMECDDLDEAIAQAEFDVKESLAAAAVIKKATGMADNEWPSAHDRRLYLALEQHFCATFARSSEAPITGSFAPYAVPECMSPTGRFSMVNGMEIDTPATRLALELGRDIYKHANEAGVAPLTFAQKITEAVNEALRLRSMRSAKEAISQPITHVFVYHDALRTARLAVRYADGTEEDRPATQIEEGLAARTRRALDTAAPRGDRG